MGIPESEILTWGMFWYRGTNGIANVPRKEKVIWEAESFELAG